ncbi:MAG: YcgN family cysteine cluster protein [Proteobacteria bacterium]|nr:YcgN family cysteine cluster protein [Pseudomonadota bacterium]
MKEFWKNKAFNELSTVEWESLCDGCARCCLHKIEDEDTGEVFDTWVGCQYLDTETCHCNHYLQRNDLVKNCIWLTPDKALELKWIPKTCAYRLLAEGKELMEWHPLVSGDPESVHKAGISVRGKIVPELNVDPEEIVNYIMGDWDDELV